MKKTNKKGFTLVELAIVIAVIAILAAVLIFTFASVIRKANDSAKIQQIKNDEIVQKADDIIAKIEDSNWLGWDDLEASIVAKIAEVVKTGNAGANTPLTSEQVRAIVEDALTTVLANQGNTGLTADQVKSVVENALGTLKYEGVTEAQVRAIVKAASNEVVATQLTAAQVRSIVTTANANNLTAADILVALGSANIANADNITTAVGNVTTAIGNATAGLATSAQVEELKGLIEDISTTVLTNDLEDVVLAKGLNIKLAKSNKVITTPSDIVEAVDQSNPVYGVSSNNLVLLDLENKTFVVVTAERDTDSGCYKVVYATNIATDEDLHNEYKYWTFKKETSTTATYDEFSVYLLDGSSVETVTLTGVGLDVGKNENVSNIEYNGDGTSHNVIIRTDGGKLTVEDQNLATINHYGDLDSLDIIECHTSSYHEFGNVKCVNIKKGHISFEENSSVEAIHFEKADRDPGANESDPDTYDTIIVSFADGVEQPDYSRDKTIIDPVDGTKVCTLNLPEETNNIYLTLQGIYEQIKIEPADISGTSTGAKEWVNTSNATNETKVASDQIANQYKDRTSALEDGAEVAEVAGADTATGERTFTPQTLENVEITDIGETKSSFESKYTVNSIFADYLKLESIPGEDILRNKTNYGILEEDIIGLYENNKDTFNTIIYGAYYDDKNNDDSDDDELVLQNGRSYSAVDEESYLQDDEKYRYWHGDFVVSFNKDIAAFDGSNLSNNIILVGEYGEWGWLKFPLTTDLSAGSKFRLIDSYMGGSISINYEELCTLVKTFKCGAVYIAPEGYDTSDPLVITIEFRMYETLSDAHNVETGEYIVVDTYEYTFNY